MSLASKFAGLCAASLVSRAALAGAVALYRQAGEQILSRIRAT